MHISSFKLNIAIYEWETHRQFLPELCFRYELSITSIYIRQFSPEKVYCKGMKNVYIFNIKAVTNDNDTASLGGY